MNTITYQKDALRTNSADHHDISIRLGSHKMQQILHADIGVATESGEILDAIKKHVYYGKKLDTVNLIEEVGDVMWYLAVLLDQCGSTFDEAMEKNIAKLKTRFPDGFTEDKALNRDLNSERKGLEAPV